MTKTKKKEKESWVAVDQEVSYLKWSDDPCDNVILVRYKVKGSPPKYGVAFLAGRTEENWQQYHGYYYDAHGNTTLGYRRGWWLEGCVTKWWGRRSAAVKVIERHLKMN